MQELFFLLFQQLLHHRVCLLLQTQELVDELRLVALHLAHIGSQFLEQPQCIVQLLPLETRMRPCDPVDQLLNRMQQIQ